MVGERRSANLCISAITTMELKIGVLLIARKDAAQGALLRAWLEQQVLPEFAERTLPIDTAVAQRSAKLPVPDQRGEQDALIAATAWVHRMTFVTCNVSDFLPTGVATLNPWEAI